MKEEKEGKYTEDDIKEFMRDYWINERREGR